MLDVFAHSEILDKRAQGQVMQLTEISERFVMHWGEMSARWGVNRTVGQIHALLYLAGEPMHAEAICETLSIARSNVSTSLRELMDWSLARVVHVRGERRDYYEAQHDIWEIFRAIAQGRRRRELDPTLAMVRGMLADTGFEGEDATTRVRIRQVHDFLQLGLTWSEEMQRLDPAMLTQIMKLGANVRMLLGSTAPSGPAQ
jgi:DNA-binding transcriptional regulator GbsR (MarR family)